MDQLLKLLQNVSVNLAFILPRWKCPVFSSDQYSLGSVHITFNGYNGKAPEIHAKQVYRVTLVQQRLEKCPFGIYRANMCWYTPKNVEDFTIPYTVSIKHLP